MVLTIDALAVKRALAGRDSTDTPGVSPKGEPLASGTTIEGPKGGDLRQESADAQDHQQF